MQRPVEPLATENLLEKQWRGTPTHQRSLLSRSLLPSIYADARYIDAAIVPKAVVVQGVKPPHEHVKKDGPLRNPLDLRNNTGGVRRSLLGGCGQHPHPHSYPMDMHVCMCMHGATHGPAADRLPDHPALANCLATPFAATFALPRHLGTLPRVQVCHHRLCDAVFRSSVFRILQTLLRSSQQRDTGTAVWIGVGGVGGVCNRNAGLER